MPTPDAGPQLSDCHTACSTMSPDSTASRRRPARTPPRCLTAFGQSGSVLDPASWTGHGQVSHLPPGLVAGEQRFFQQRRAEEQPHVQQHRRTSTLQQLPHVLLQPHHSRLARQPPGLRTGTRCATSADGIIKTRRQEAQGAADRAVAPTGIHTARRCTTSNASSGIKNPAAAD